MPSHPLLRTLEKRQRVWGRWSVSNDFPAWKIISFSLFTTPIILEVSSSLLPQSLASWIRGRQMEGGRHGERGIGVGLGEDGGGGIRTGIFLLGVRCPSDLESPLIYLCLGLDSSSWNAINCWASCMLHRTLSQGDWKPALASLTAERYPPRGMGDFFWFTQRCYMGCRLVC